jgi:ribosomal protein L11 methyltransferase
LIRLAIRVRRADAEVVLAELLALAPSGVEEIDVSASVVEYAVYGPPGELPALPEVRAVVGGALVEIATTEIADDWSERWREFHRPLVLGDRLVVRPPWEAAMGAGLDLVIDPGQAFGTGAHATTRLCLELLLELPAAGGCIDLGCGSGVLGICAAALGWGPVLALDYDPLSVAAAAENARVNGVELEVRRFDLRTEPVPGAPLVLANLLRPLLLEWCEQLAGGVAQRPGAVIASGLLSTEADEVAAAFAAVGLHEVERHSHSEWSALRLTG